MHTFAHVVQFAMQIVLYVEYGGNCLHCRFSLAFLQYATLDSLHIVCMFLSFTTLQHLHCTFQIKLTDSVTRFLHTCPFSVLNFEREWGRLFSCVTMMHHMKLSLFAADPHPSHFPRSKPLGRSKHGSTFTSTETNNPESWPGCQIGSSLRDPNGSWKEGGRPFRAAAARALTGEESRESREVSLTKIGRTHSQNQEELWKTLSKTVGDHCATLTPLY